MQWDPWGGVSVYGSTKIEIKKNAFSRISIPEHTHTHTPHKENKTVALNLFLNLGDISNHQFRNRHRSLYYLPIYLIYLFIIEYEVARNRFRFIARFGRSGGFGPRRSFQLESERKQLLGFAFRRGFLRPLSVASETKRSGKSSKKIFESIPNNNETWNTSTSWWSRSRGIWSRIIKKPSWSLLMSRCIIKAAK